MPDSYLLFSPDGATSINLATWTIANEGVDTGARDLRAPVFAENSFVEGGRLAHERNPVRAWRFPMLLASVGTYGGLDGLAAHIQSIARPDSYLDVIPAGYASTNVIRFDVLHGELAMRQYLPRVQEQAHRRFYDLLLRTAPFGYMPTWMTLGSAASVGLPGVMALTNAASIMGDAPGLAVLVVAPTQTAVTTGPGTWVPDVIAWSLGGRPSFLSLLGGGSWQRPMPSGAYSARSESVTGTANSIFMSPTANGWTTLSYYDIASGLEPAYRGRFRSYLYGRQHPELIGEPNVMQILLDAVPAAVPSQPMASGGLIATVPVQPASSFAVHMLDLGVVQLPPVASGVQQALRLRLWGRRASHAGTANSFLDLNGLSLLPEIPGGIVARSIALPAFGAPSAGAVKIDTERRTVEVSPGVGAGAGSIASGLPVRDGFAGYRGGFPYVGASQVQVDLAGAARRAESGTAYLAEVIRDAPLAFYRLQETSAATLVDSSGNSRHGSYPLGGSYAQPGGFDPGNNTAHYINGASQFAQSASDVRFNFTATHGTVELWFRRERVGHDSFDEVLFAHGTQLAAGTISAFEVVILGASAANNIASQRGALAVKTYPYSTLSGNVSFVGTRMRVDDTDWHHLVVRVAPAANVLVSLTLDNSATVSAALGASYGCTGPLFFGRSVIATRFFAGGLDDISIYHGSLTDERVAVHFQAGKGATGLIARPAPQHAAAALLYRPRFTFLKNV